MTNNFKDNLTATPVIAILRGVTPETVIPVCEALFEGGIRFIEVTLNSPDPILSIRKAVESLAPRGVHIGAGTVIQADDVDRVAEAGGTYIISPNTDPAVIRRTKEMGLISIPGFFTPSEAFTALAAGADYLKCFPVGRLGAAYIKDLRAVIPAPILAVGGINSGNAQDYLKAGAIGLGVGSDLYKAQSTPEEINRNTREFIARLAQET